MVARSLYKGIKLLNRWLCYLFYFTFKLLSKVFKDEKTRNLMEALATIADFPKAICDSMTQIGKGLNGLADRVVLNKMDEGPGNKQSFLLTVDINEKESFTVDYYLKDCDRETYLKGYKALILVFKILSDKEGRLSKMLRDKEVVVGHYTFDPNSSRDIQRLPYLNKDMLACAELVVLSLCSKDFKQIREARISLGTTLVGRATAQNIATNAIAEINIASLKGKLDAYKEKYKDDPVEFARWIIKNSSLDGLIGGSLYSISGRKMGRGLIFLSDDGQFKLRDCQDLPGLCGGSNTYSESAATYYADLNKMLQGYERLSELMFAVSIGLSSIYLKKSLFVAHDSSGEATLRGFISKKLFENKWITKVEEQEAKNPRSGHVMVVYVMSTLSVFGDSIWDAMCHQNLDKITIND